MKRPAFLSTLARAAIAALALPAAFAATADAALDIVATTSDLGSLARAVGGEAVQVTVLARPGEDPHFVDARPSFLRALRKADLLLEGGADLESGWLPPLVNNARNARILAGANGRFSAAAAAAIPLRDVPATLDRSQGDVHAHGNPHFLLAPDNAARVAGTLAAKFAELDPANADAFRARAARFAGAAELRQRDWRKRLAHLRGAGVVTYHHSYDYFLAAFDLRLADTIEPKPGIEPSGSHLIALAKRGRAASIKLILAEPNRSTRLCERVARDLSAPLLRLPLMPANADAPDAYLEFIEQNVSAIEKALPAPKAAAAAPAAATPTPVPTP